MYVSSLRICLPSYTANISIEQVRGGVKLGVKRSFPFPVTLVSGHEQKTMNN